MPFAWLLSRVRRTPSLGGNVVSETATVVALACFGATDADVKTAETAENAENAENVARKLPIVVAGVVFSVAIVAAARMVLWK